jgi:hypothetical protein
MSKQKFTNEFGIDTETLIKGGGCAFPFSIEIDDNKSMAYSHGMTLRDYFAAKAMQADLTDGRHEDQFAWCAERAYKMADAMLKAREL